VLPLQLVQVQTFDALQVQVRVPGTFPHDACTAQPPLLVAHSLMSVHDVPGPV
jgi:hypothetical protein